VVHDAAPTLGYNFKPAGNFRTTPTLPGRGGAIYSTFDYDEQFERIFRMAPSPCNVMLFCQGCVAEMGMDVPSAIRRIGSQGKIAYVHFRNRRVTCAGTPASGIWGRSTKPGAVSRTSGAARRTARAATTRAIRRRSGRATTSSRDGKVTVRDALAAADLALTTALTSG
jgi:hypothetical protein